MVSRKPPVGTKIDLSHPLVKGMVAAYAMDVSGRLVDMLDAHHSTTVGGTPKVVTTRYGLATAFNAGGDNFTIPDHADLNVTGDFSFAIGATPAQAGLNQELLEKQSGNPLWQLRTWGDNTFSFMGRDSSGTLRDARTTSSFTVGEIVHLVGRKDVESDRISIWFNGVREGNVTDTSDGDWSNSIALRIAKGNTGEFKGQIHYIYIFQSSLPASTIKSIKENPWQVFKPQRVYVPLDFVTIDADTIDEILSSVIVTDVNTTEIWVDGDTGLPITGTGFV